MVEEEDVEHKMEGMVVLEVMVVVEDMEAEVKEWVERMRK